MKLLIYSSQCDLCRVQAQSSTLRTGIGWQNKVPVMFAKSRNILPLWMAVTSLQTDHCAEDRNPHFVPFRENENISISA